MSLITPLNHFHGTRDARRPMERVDNVKQAAQDFRRDMLARPKVRYYQSFELVRIPYPSQYGYLNAYAGMSPYIHLVNRLFVIQFDSNEGLKTLLVSPMDWENQRDTPYFRRLIDRVGAAAPVQEALVTRKTNTVLDVLADIGLKAEDVDYITYDHMHTVNLQRWLGAHGQPALLPNAKLLIMRDEWDCALGAVPWQSQWFCPHGLEGIPEQKLIFLDQDVMLGDGSVALIRTPGHTEGNHSIVAHTDDGLFVTSENGVSLDAYAPELSRIPKIAEYAKATGAEVILNGNTQEQAVEQYISMVQEKYMAGPSKLHEQVPNMALSSESDGFWLFPGTQPSFRMGSLKFGSLQKR
jgi:hypothetical protein